MLFYKKISTKLLRRKFYRRKCHSTNNIAFSENNLTKCHVRKEVTEESTTTLNDDDNTDIYEEQQQANVILLPSCLQTSTSTVSTMNNATLLSTTTLDTPSVPSATLNINTSSGPTEHL
ncbi:unnamed protein product [Rotaria sp. Silwood1]|nr:unnamed protein product [Rotaria sp. Silwood1]